ncbi:MAG: class II aldolase/adducin family protein [Acidobacteriota bacterium]
MTHFQTIPPHEAEGVIKFAAEHEHRALEVRRYGDAASSLVAWRQILRHTALVGQDPARYGGYGYGNVSTRVGPPSAGRGRRSFLVSGTQTSGIVDASLEHFCLVESYDVGRNRVLSRGLVKPSSESLTHAAVYDLGPQIRFVFHAHSSVLWRAARALRLPTTNPQVSYGTPEMAAEVQRLYRSTALAESRLLVMGGHEDGFVAFGRTAEEAGQTLLSALAQAYEIDSRKQHGLETRR